MKIRSLFNLKNLLHTRIKIFVTFSFFFFLFSSLSVFVFSQNVHALSYSDFLTDKLELKFINSNLSKITDVSYSWPGALLSRDIKPYSETSYSSSMSSQIDRVADAFRQILSNGSGSWWVVSNQDGFTNQSYNGTSGIQWTYSFYFHSDPNLRFSDPSCSDTSSYCFIRFLSGDQYIKNVTRIDFSYTLNTTGNSYTTYHFVSETPKIHFIAENSISGFTIDDKHRLFLANVSNASDLNLPNSFSFGSNDNQVPAHKTSIYPRIFIYYQSGTIYASSDLDYYSELGVPNPSLNVFFLLDSSGQVLQTSSLNNLAVWRDIPKGSYRVAFAPMWHPDIAPDGYELKKVFYDIETDPDGDSFLISYDSDRDRYCFSSNRLKDNSPENYESLENPSSAFAQFVGALKTGSITPGALYNRCYDFPQPSDNTDPSDFSNFSPQTFSAYTQDCAVGDVGCHLDNFVIKFFNKLSSLIKYLFVPKFEDVKNSLTISMSFLQNSMGSFKGLYDVFESFVNIFVKGLFSSAGSYSSPCNIFGNLTFFGVSTSLDICVFERSVGSTIFNRIRMFISIGLYFSGILVVRSIYLNILHLISSGRKG